MTNKTKCPLCLNRDGGSCQLIRGGERHETSVYSCNVCGIYGLTIQARYYLGVGASMSTYRQLTRQQGSVLSHKVRTITAKNGNDPLMVTQQMLERWLSSGELPTPAMQAENLMRFVGDRVSRSGANITTLPDYIGAVVGAPNYRAAIDLAKELGERGLFRLNLQGGTREISGSPTLVSIPKDITLSLDGWERYESGKRGQFSGDYGFIAMKFDDPVLDPFVRDTVKPAIKESMGYDLVDMRDVTVAGIIDNIMRVQIRDSAFVIVDLTHDNPGAYWEAGYAEGLGKPVIYICERSKFEEKSTHFDTNHCTTIPWSTNKVENFKKELVATLRRSLDLHD